MSKRKWSETETPKVSSTKCYTTKWAFWTSATKCALWLSKRKSESSHTQKEKIWIFCVTTSFLSIGAKKNLSEAVVCCDNRWNSKAKSSLPKTESKFTIRYSKSKGKISRKKCKRSTKTSNRICKSTRSTKIGPSSTMWRSPLNRRPSKKTAETTLCNWQSKRTVSFVWRMQNSILRRINWIDWGTMKITKSSMKKLSLNNFKPHWNIKMR